MNSEKVKNPLVDAPIGKLMMKYAIPSVIALVVNALYNIVDQIFIGWGVGTLGNSATNVIFPLNLMVTSLSLLIGDGGAAYLSLELGKKHTKEAQKGVNNTFAWLIIVGIAVTILSIIFLKSIAGILGATTDNLPYALAYGKIVILGFPFVVVGSGLCSVIRADGTPQLTMIGMIVGCVANVILDAWFVMGLGWGMEGAALATILGQILNFLICIWYIPRFKTVKINLKDMKPSIKLIKRIASLGISSFVSQFAIAVIMAVINYYLVSCGSQTEYGADIPLAAFGIVMKFNTILTAIVTGIATGAQPIIGYNYGCADYKRVKKTLRIAIEAATIVAVICFLIFQIFPYQLTAMFGDQGELYTQFSVMSFRIFTMLCIVNGFQIVSSIFFQSIGKALISGLLSFSRQIIFLIPATIILCSCIGLNGVLWAGPVADGLAFILAIILIIWQIRVLNTREKSKYNDIQMYD